MSNNTHQTLEEAKQAGKYIREVKSYVKREGRLTNAQANAIETHWGSLGLDYTGTLIDFSKEFGNNNSLVLEIGFGMGHSLVETAKQNPDKNYIGIEVHTPGVGACIASAVEENVNNLRVFEHDAVEVLKNCVADNSLSKLQLFFPDPWHKKRHHKRRIVQSAFVESIRQKLAIGGVFHMATDWENYAEHMLEIMQSAEDFTNQSKSSDYVPRPESRPVTKFEKRGERLGHGVWDLMFERNA